MYQASKLQDNGIKRGSKKLCIDMVGVEINSLTFTVMNKILKTLVFIIGLVIYRPDLLNQSRKSSITFNWSSS